MRSADKWRHEINQKAYGNIRRERKKTRRLLGVVIGFTLGNKEDVLLFEKKNSKEQGSLKYLMKRGINTHTSCHHLHGHYV